MQDGVNIQNGFVFFISPHYDSTSISNDILQSSKHHCQGRPPPCNSYKTLSFIEMHTDRILTSKNPKVQLKLCSSETIIFGFFFVSFTVPLTVRETTLKTNQSLLLIPIAIHKLHFPSLWRESNHITWPAMPPRTKVSGRCISVSAPPVQGAWLSSYSVP